MRLLPRRQPTPPFLELVTAAQVAWSAIEGMRRSCSDEKRRALFRASDRLGVTLGKMGEHRSELPANVQEKVDAVVRAVSEYSCLDASVILGRSRVEDVVAARDLVIYLLREDLGLGPVAIGRQVDRDHSSVLTSFRRTERGPERGLRVGALRDVRAMLDGLAKGA